MELSTADRALAEGSTLDLASPEARAARRQRMEGANQREATRLADLYEARVTRRKHGVRTAAELYTELNNLITSLDGCLGGSDLDGYRKQLVELACDIETDLLDPSIVGNGPLPELERPVGHRAEFRQVAADIVRGH